MTDSEDILATGTATQTQLAKLFGRDKNSMPRLLQGVAPVGKRKGFPIYKVAEAAAMLVEVGYDVEERLRHMNQADLPPLLSKEFWNGQSARKKFEKESGNLWETEDVMAMVASLLHEVAINQKLMLDNVERQAGLNANQRAAIQRISEGTVNATREAVIERFGQWPVPQDNVSGVLEDEL